MSIVTTDDKTCITVNEGFQTSALTDSEGGGDIFIGFGNTLALGLYEVSIFPNPASQTVTLDFELMQSATVNVEIYDLAGKIHKVSIQEQLTAGRQLKTKV